MTAKATHRPLVLAAVMAANFMIAVEATIVATAMPQIVGDLGGLDLYSWVFSAFLLTQTATTVAFGKLADSLGRKRVILAGVAIFLVGSTLAGFAWSMPSMIAFRLVQGVGAGAVQTVAMTIVGDLYGLNERGRVQGYLSSVWAASAIVGPLAGAFIIQHVSWAWVFWINLPVGLAAGAGFAAFLHETAERKATRFNHAGAALFTLAIAAVMALLTAISSAGGLEIGALTAASSVALALFVAVERRSPEPMISPKLWGRRAIAAVNAASLLSGMVMIGITTFLPVYVQGVMQRPPVTAGFALSAMVLGWPIGATLSARSFVRLGLTPVLRVGILLAPLGAAAFVFLRPETSPFVAGCGAAIVGLGLGLSSSASIVMIQEIVDWSERGSVTAAYLFARSLGNTFGATLFGAVLNFGLGRAGGASSEDLRRLLGEASKGGAVDAVLRAALAGSLHVTFVATALIGVAAAVAGFMAPAVMLGQRRAGA